MLYHYTNRDSAADARRDGVLRAYPVIVCKDLFGRESAELAPAVWFTTEADRPSLTVLAKMQINGWPLDKPGMVWRFAVDDAVAPLTLDQWAYPHEYEPALFRWMMATAHMAGESWEDWRLSAVDVPAEQWLAVQSLHGDRWKDEG